VDSIELLRDHLAKSTERVLAKVEEMADHCLVPPTPNGGGHTLWILGHLAYIEALVIRGFLQGEVNPLAAWEETFDGTDVATDADRFPPFAEVLAACRDQRARTMALLATLTEADLDRPSAAAPEGHDATFGTWRLCFQFVADHWYMHRGQLADSRRAAAIDRMGF